MYQFRPATDRIRKMRDLIRDRVIRGDAERALITAEALQKYKNIVPIIKRPMVTYDICSKMTVRVEDFELIVGSKAKNFCGSSGAYWPLFIDIEREWTKKEDGLWHNPEGEELRLCIAQEDIDAVRSVAPILRENSYSAVGDAWYPDGAEEFFSLGACDFSDPLRPGIMTLPAGHLTPGWGKILNVGYKAIRKQAQDWMDARRGNIMGDDMSKYMFYKSAVIVCDAATTLIRRFSEACARKAEETAEPVRRAELLKMADGLLWISENPARTFWEACQAAIMYQLFLSIEGGYPAPAFGRFDQYTWPFLKKDLKEGRLTLDEAQEICDAFFLKANCFYEGGIGKLAETTGIGNTYQHTTIGGVDPDTGEDATNPVTFMVLETIGRLKLHDPTISLRTNKNTPDALWNCALETSKLVGGLPLPERRCDHPRSHERTGLRAA